MTILVVYTSKTGYTQTYATWIAQELDAKLIQTADLTAQDIERADIIIHGGGLRAVAIGGLRKFMRHWPQLKTKHVVLWHTGANPGDAETTENVWKQNLTDEQREHTTRFYLRGGFDYNQLRGVDKAMMAMMRAFLKRKKNLSDTDRGVLDMCENPRTELDRTNIQPLVNHVRSLEEHP